MPTPIEILLDPVSLSLITIYISLILIETIAPGQQQKKIKGWLPRALLSFVVYFYLASYLPLIWDKYLVEYQVFNIEYLNPYVATFIAVLVFEFFIYVWHRAMHQTPWLWRTFHQLHHSAERVDTLGAFYFSPLDMVGFTMVGSIALAVVVGISPEAVTYFLLVTMFLATFQHTNIKTPQWLGYFIQRPESHSVHHGRGIHGYNYSDLPLFDIVFGTFRNPKHFAPKVGFYSGASSHVADMLMFKDIQDLEYRKSREQINPKEVRV